MIKFLSVILYIIARVLNFTYRFKFMNREVLEKVEKSHIVAIWHQNIIACVFSHFSGRYVAMASASKDGELIARTLKWLGQETVRGSTKKKGQEALELMIKKMKEEHYCAAITVDGPRGPAREVKRGVVELSKQTGASILPTIAYPEHFWSFNSWDKFRLPKPFSKIFVRYGEPILVRPDVTPEEFEAIKLQVKESLDNLEISFIKEKTNASHT